MLKENAATIYNIIKGVRDNVEEDSDEEKGQQRFKNEFSWQHDGAKQVLAQLEREDFDCYYDSDMSDDAKREFEDRYEAYKREKERAVRAAKHMKKIANINAKPVASRELFTEAALTAPGLRTINS